MTIAVVDIFGPSAPRIGLLATVGSAADQPANGAIGNAHPLARP
jgi:hypothetical protein